MEALLEMIVLDKRPDSRRGERNNWDVALRWMRMQSYLKKKEAVRLISELGEPVQPNLQAQGVN